MSKQGFLYDLRGRRSRLEASQTKFLWGQGAFPRKGPFIYKLQEKQKKEKEKNKEKKKHVSSDAITNPVFCKTVFVYLVRYKNIHSSVCDKKRGLENIDEFSTMNFPPQVFSFCQTIFGSGPSSSEVIFRLLHFLSLSFYRALMDCLVLPIQSKMEDWKKVTISLDKEHARGMYYL